MAQGIVRKPTTRAKKKKKSGSEKWEEEYLKKAAKMKNYQKAINRSPATKKAFAKENKSGLSEFTDTWINQKALGVTLQKTKSVSETARIGRNVRKYDKENKAKDQKKAALKKIKSLK